MAGSGGGQRRNRVVVLIKDKRDDYFVYNVGIGHLFQPGAWSGTDTRRLPRPVGQIPKPLQERIDFALAADGATLVGVTSHRRTLLYDTRSGASSAGPDLHGAGYSRATHVIPLGPRFYALETQVTTYEHANPAGQDCALLRPGGSSSWRTLPDPPPDLRCFNHFQTTCDLAAYFTAGARVWVSATGRGTYTFHTATRAWRKEGDWELPFHHRALLVPDLDNLCFGLCSKNRHLVALDIGKSPPRVLYEWEDTFPSWLLHVTGKSCALNSEGSLVYLGDGKFCIAWSAFMEDAIPYGGHNREHFVQFIAVQLAKTSTSSGNNKLRIVKLKACCYKMPADGRMAQAF